MKIREKYGILRLNANLRKKVVGDSFTHSFLPSRQLHIQI